MKKWLKNGIQKVGIITKRNVSEYQSALKKLVKVLEKAEYKISFDTNSAKCLKRGEGFKKEDILKTNDLVIILGGDGTLLKTARRLSKKRVLIFAVNFGNLGFLTDVSENKMMEALDKILNGDFQIDERNLLRVTIYRQGKKHKTMLALNEAVINQGAFARLIELNLQINNRKLVNFKADGLIVATPTGSTAHSLSAGGAIVHPRIAGIIITPICSSTLTMRPIVIPNDRELKVIIKTERQDLSNTIGMTVDGQDVEILECGDIVKIRKSSRILYLVKTKISYYKTLRKKLNWGE